MMSTRDAHERLLGQRMDTFSDIGCWRVVAASAPGTSHEKLGQPCQDAHHWATFPESVLVAAVADGAGSAELGHVGATIAARTAVETIGRQEHLPRGPDDE